MISERKQKIILLRVRGGSSYEAKITLNGMKEIQGKSSDFGSSSHEVGVNEGSSHRESTVLIQSLFALFDYYDRWEKIQLRLIATGGNWGDCWRCRTCFATLRSS